MALLRLRYEAECLSAQVTKQNLSGQQSPTPNQSYPYRASGLVHWPQAAVPGRITGDDAPMIGFDPLRSVANGRYGADSFTALM